MVNAYSGIMSISETNLSLLKKVVLEYLDNENLKIVLFGSRARGDNNMSADVDLGIIPKGEFDKRRLVLLREKIENLNIPYEVDIVDLSTVSEEFKKEALKEALVWKD